MLARERGDTLIEVLFAVSIFSAVAVGTIVIMNQGIASAQQALEINLVRNQIDTQAELLRHLNNAKLTSLGRNDTDESKEWDKAVGQGAGGSYQPSATAASYGAIAKFEDCKPGSLPVNAFFVNPATGKVIRQADVPGNAFRETQTFAQVQALPGATPPTQYISNMLWVEPVSSTRDTSTYTLDRAGYYDFHIRACWESPGAGGGVMKLGTIVRLYVPNT